MKQLELIAFQNGLSESHMYCNWIHLYYSRVLFNSQKHSEAIEHLSEKVNQFVEALDGESLHPTLCPFYQAIGSFCMTVQMKQKAEEYYQKLYDIKVMMHGRFAK